MPFHRCRHGSPFDSVARPMGSSSALAIHRAAAGRALLSLRASPTWTLLALLVAVSPVRAQSLPAANTSFVQLQLSGCGTFLVYSQVTLSETCPYVLGQDTPGGTSANGSNLGGVLRGNTSANVAAVNLRAESRSHWDDRFTYLGGAIPASVILRFQLSGIFNANVSGSSAAGNEVVYQAYVRPVGSWGSSGSYASGTLNPRQYLDTPGMQRNDFQAVLQGLTLPVSLAGIAVGNSLELSTSFLQRSWASANRGGVADAEANFSDSAGLAGLQFLDALGADITPQVQWSWQYGTQMLAPVPEAPALWLVLAGLAGLWTRHRSRRGQVQTA